MRAPNRLDALFALALLAAAPAAALAQADWDPTRLVPPPLGKVTVPKPERWTMPNGMVVYLLENHELPVVTGSVNVLSSPTFVPDDKVGLAALTGEVMRSGGSKEHPGDALDDRLAAIGASISTSITADVASASFRALSDNTAEVVATWADVMRRPAFPDDKIELSKVGMRRAIASRNDEMIPLLVRVASEGVYGKDSPYSRKAEYATVEAITRDDAVKLHARVFAPERMVMAIYGDFRAADMKRLLTRAFGDWRKSGTAAPPAPPLPAATKQRVRFAPKDDVTQTGLILAHLGFRASEPDYAAMNVLETALGGGFQSRLFNRIRTERGLAYAAGAQAGSDYLRPGVFLAYSLTRNDSAMAALDLLREEVVRVTQEPLSAQELESAKQSVQNSFVFNFEEPAQVLFRTAYYELTGYPADFLTTYQQQLETVTAASVLEAAKRRIRPAELVTVIVGKESEFDRPLAGLGQEVERVDIRIPPPPSKTAVGEATPEALAKGRALLEQAAAKAGGPAAFAAVRTVVMETSGTLSMQGQNMNVTGRQSWKLPGQWVTVMTLPMGELRQGSDGTTGWMSMMGQVRDNPPMAQAVKERWERSFWRLFGHPDQVTAQALGPQTVDGKTYETVFVRSDVVQDLVLWFDAEGWLARIEYTDEGQNGPARFTEVYADWKPVGKVHLPHATTILTDGQTFMDGKVSSVELDAPLDDAMFRKPTP